MLGTRKDAATIATWVRTRAGDMDDWDFQSFLETPEGTLPTGWSYLGSGMHRHVFLSPSGVAYKVNHKRHPTSNVVYTNMGEFQAYHLITDRARTYPGWRIAEIYLHPLGNGEPVIAAEYIKGTHVKGDAWSLEELRASEDAAEHFGIGDMSAANYVLTASGERVIIDLTTDWD